jgi:hypothetical protein
MFKKRKEKCITLKGDRIVVCLVFFFPLIISCGIAIELYHILS